MNQPKLTRKNFKKAKDFILTNARMIERRLFHFHFENDNNDGVYHSVYAYRNSDGGFGHGMEPDTASPESQPLFSIMALETLDEVNYLTKEIILNDFMPYFTHFRPKSYFKHDPKIFHSNCILKFSHFATYLKITLFFF